MTTLDHLSRVFDVLYRIEREFRGRGEIGRSLTITLSISLTNLPSTIDFSSNGTNNNIYLEEAQICQQQFS